MNTINWNVVNEIKMLVSTTKYLKMKDLKMTGYVYRYGHYYVTINETFKYRYTNGLIEVL